LEFLGVYYTKNLGAFKSDGLVGLGPKKHYDSKYPNNKRVFVSEMQKSGVIDEAIFSVKLGKIDNSNLKDVRET